MGEFGYLIVWPTSDIELNVVQAVQRLTRALHAAQLPGLVDLIPAYASLGVVFEPTLEAHVRSDRHAALAREIERAADRVERAKHATAEPDASRLIEIPVHYGVTHGADFEALCQRTGLSAAQLIAAHCAPTYTVAMLGFAPGFPYLIGLDPRLHCPRHATPRTRVAAGSVGIAGMQTGIYPFAGPGGWQLIGHTDLPLFDPLQSSPSLLQPGDRVRFVAASDDNG